MNPDRSWLITWTCYGNWLPGDRRGFVGNVRDENGIRIIHNVPGTPYDEDLPRLEAWVRQHMQGEPVTLTQPEADALITQYRETARIREWSLEAASVMLQVGSYKLRGGKRIFKMAPLHHHFELLGWSESKVIARFWILALVFALFALTTLKLR